MVDVKLTEYTKGKWKVIVERSKGDTKTYHLQPLTATSSASEVEKTIRLALEAAGVTANDAQIKGWTSKTESQIKGGKIAKGKEEKPAAKADEKKKPEEKKSAPKVEEKKSVAKAPEKPPEITGPAKIQESIKKLEKAAESMREGKSPKQIAREMRAERAAKAKAEKEIRKKAKQEMEAKVREEKKKLDAEKKAHKDLPKGPLQPIRDVSFIVKQFGELQKGGDRMTPAVNALHENSAFIGKNLSTRAQEQKAASVAAFNALWGLPKFVDILFLASKTDKVKDMKEFPNLKREFTAVWEYIHPAPGKTRMLDASTPDSIISAANMYARYYLLVFTVSRNKELLEELKQLPELSERLRSVDRIGALDAKPGEKGEPSKKEKALTDVIKGDMDPDTITASALYIRRYKVIYPPEGAENEKMDVWSAPKIIVPQEEKPAEQKTEAPKEKTPLEKYADQKWKNLKNDLSSNAARGNAEAMARLYKTEVPGKISIEAALKQLGRDDMDRAVDQVFNEYFKKSKPFMDFCLGNDQYKGIARKIATSMSPNTDPGARRIIINAMEAFINEEASRKSAKWYERLKDDLKILYSGVLGSPSDKLGLTGVPDMRLLSAIAVYTWREKNREAPVGAFAAKIEGVKVPEVKKAEETTHEPAKPRPRPMKWNMPE
jgi:hypothetical protein